VLDSPHDVTATSRYRPGESPVTTNRPASSVRAPGF
jgi:hypothetical protein